MKAVPPHPAAGPAQAPEYGIFHFSGFTLDLSKGLLSRGEKAIELRPKSWALLVFMVRNAGRVLSKDELLNAVWDDVTVTEDSLTQCIRDIRLALGEEGQALIRTLPRRGYIFETTSLANEPNNITLEPDSGPPQLAVLPFRNLGGSRDQDYIAVGITEDIVTALARFSSLVLTGHHVVSGLADELNSGNAATLLGVDYVAEGSVRFAGDRLRITARLMAATTGKTLWAERFDRPLDGIFSIQDEVVTSIVAALDDRLVATGAGLARRKTAATWSAYDCLLQGRDLCNQHREVEAIPYFKEAVRLGPDNAASHGWLAIAQSLAFAITGEKEYLKGATASGTLALRCDDRDDIAQWGKALSLMWNGQLPEAEQHLRRAMQLNPANVQIRGDHANWLRYMGRYDEALAEIDTALMQDRFAPYWFRAVRGGILLDMGQYTEALAELRQLPYQNVHVLMHQVAAHARLGDAVAATTALGEMRKMIPHASIRLAVLMHPYANAPALEALAEALRMAGVPEN